MSNYFEATMQKFIKEKQDTLSIQYKLFSSIKAMFHSGELFAVTVSAYLLVSILNISIIHKTPTEIGFVSEINILMSLGYFVICLGLILLLRAVFKNTHGLFFIMNTIVMVFGLLVILENTKDVYLTLGVTGIVAFILYYTSIKLNIDSWEIHPTKDYSFLSISVAFILMSTLLALATIYRYKTFNSSTYDLGIFTQMYDYLRLTGLPTTTIERNQLLSHFAIHFSPIYYLLLPGYFVFRSPEYLLSMQAVIICSAAFPIYKLARHFDLGKLNATFLALSYLFYPGTLSPAFYDFHENKFLTVLLLWMLYFYEKKNFIPMYLALVSVLFVKEDAALYIIFFGLYSIFARKNVKHGLIIFTLGTLYFISVTAFLTYFGHGIMDSRFRLYQLQGETGLGVVVKNILANPLFFITNLFTASKFEFILFMLSPLLFIPLITKKWTSFIFLLPMVVINLMTDYPYQFDIGYQYTYGVAAILFYLCIINLSAFPRKWVRLLCLLTVFASLAFTLTATNDKFITYFKSYNENETLYVQTAEALAKIPISASVTTETFFAPQLYRVKELYMYPAPVATDYLVLDTRLENQALEEKKALIEKEGYTLYLSGGMAIIYKK